MKLLHRRKRHIPNNTSLNWAKREFPTREPGPRAAMLAVVGSWRRLRKGGRGFAEGFLSKIEIVRRNKKTKR